MAEKPIIFSGPMVRAILDGRKTQTRRINKPIRGTSHVYAVKRPYNPGDRLWVRETWGTQSAWSQYKPRDIPSGVNIYFRADYTEDWSPDSGWRPSIFMPRWASRITLRITDIWVERLQDISEEDAWAEGVYHDMPEGISPPYPPVDSFLILWDSINAKRGYGWDVNPWVWAITFERVEIANAEEVQHGR